MMMLQSSDSPASAIPGASFGTSAGDDTLRAMSLFVRLWIVATLTAFASAAAGVVILMVISTQGRVDQENRAALTLSRLVAFTVSLEPLEKLRGTAAADLLQIGRASCRETVCQYV